MWDDVGLNIPKPPDLLQLYRDFGNHQVSGKDLVDVASGVEEDELEALTPVLGNLPPPLETPQTVEVRDTSQVHKKYLKCVKAYYEILRFFFSPVLILELLTSTEIRR